MQQLRQLISSLNEDELKQYDLDFYYLCRLIELYDPSLPRIGYASDPSKELVRFGQMPTLNFVSQNVHSVSLETRGNGHNVVSVLVNFFGLLGSNGPMPYQVTDYVYHKDLNDNDPSARRFLDIINHRLLSFFYRSVSTFELPLMFDRHDPLLSNMFRAFNRLGFSEGSDLPPYGELASTVFFIRDKHSATGLESVLQSFLGINVKVQEFVECSHLIPRDVRLQLGDLNTSVLGLNAQLGTHYATRTQDINVILGPMSFDESLNYMPQGSFFNPIFALINNFLYKPMKIHLKLLIDSRTIRRLALNGSVALGQGAYLFTSAISDSNFVININMTSNATRREDRRS